VQCFTCSQEHGRRHDSGEEFVCDACRQHQEVLCPVLVPSRLDVELATPAGRRRRLRGVVAIYGLGLCEPCAAQMP
jgi:hypothetical protein